MCCGGGGGGVNQIKSTTPFGQVPMLKIGGVTIAQSSAIERAAARLAKLYGSSDIEAAQIDMIVGSVLDTNQKYSQIVNQIKDEAEKKAKVEEFFKSEFPKWAQYFTTHLKANASQSEWFVGKSISYADLSFYHYFEKLTKADPAAITPFPELKAHLERIAARPNIAAWLKARPVTAF